MVFSASRQATLAAPRRPALSKGIIGGPRFSAFDVDIASRRATFAAPRSPELVNSRIGSCSFFSCFSITKTPLLSGRGVFLWSLNFLFSGEGKRHTLFFRIEERDLEGI